ncbi:TPA: hypothetical protein N5O23_004544 [Enterobacter hormaechei subsp. steigerwaltii]|nr:hypothetical protein [Enterobacter hormaechei subsp. steigerwaltii]
MSVLSKYDTKDLHKMMIRKAEELGFSLITVHNQEEILYALEKEEYDKQLNEKLRDITNRKNKNGKGERGSVPQSKVKRNVQRRPGKKGPK